MEIPYFKIALLENNNIKKIRLFIGDKKLEDLDIDKILNEEEKKIEIEYVNSIIYFDDSIETIKKKIILIILIVLVVVVMILFLMIIPVQIFVIIVEL